MLIYTNIEEEFVDLKEETRDLVAKSVSLLSMGKNLMRNELEHFSQVFTDSRFE
jgi:hypothetical protein